MPSLLDQRPVTPQRSEITVLAVDSDVDIGVLLALVLADEGYRCATATTLAEGCRLLQTADFALVITESFSSSVTGDHFAPTAALRRMASATPVVLLTGHVVEAEAAAAAGFVGVIAKPFDVDELTACVRRWTVVGALPAVV